jgi:hypothetical protein
MPATVRTGLETDHKQFGIAERPATVGTGLQTCPLAGKRVAMNGGVARNGNEEGSE